MSSFGNHARDFGFLSVDRNKQTFLSRAANGFTIICVIIKLLKVTSSEVRDYVNRKDKVRVILCLLLNSLMKMKE